MKYLVFTVALPFMLLVNSVLFSSGANAIEKGGDDVFMQFDIPEQFLRDSLVEFAVQADITLIAVAGNIEKLQGKAIRGRYDINSAFKVLLGENPLLLRFDEDLNVYIVSDKKEKGSVSRSEKGGSDSIEELIVKAARYPYKFNTLTNTRFKNGIPYFDSARYLNAVSDSLISSVQPKNIADVISYVSGISPGDGHYDSTDDFYIRGFQRNALYIEGVRTSDASGIKRMPVTVERIEVLKGPSTMLYGQADPGGVIDIIRKKPTPENTYHLRSGAGTLGSRFLDADLNISSFDGVWNHRLVVATRAQDEAADVSDIKQHTIMPSMTWNLSPSTALNVHYEYQYNTQKLRRESVVEPKLGDIYDEVLLKDISSLSIPNVEANADTFSFSFNHKFSESWSLTANYFHSSEFREGVRSDNMLIFNANNFVNSDDLYGHFFYRVIASQVAIPVLIDVDISGNNYRFGDVRNMYSETSSDYSTQGDLDVSATLNTGGIVHRVRTGISVNNQDFYTRYGIQVKPLLTNRVWNELDFSLAYYELNKALTSTLSETFHVEDDGRRLLTYDYSVFAHDNIQLNPSLHVSVGTRYNLLRGEHIGIADNSSVDLDPYSAFTSQLGLVYKPSSKHSIYINYAEGVKANYLVDNGSKNISQPENSEQFELGFKSHFLAIDMIASASLFKINKWNMTDLALDNTHSFLLTGGRHQVIGVDGDLTWQVVSGLDVVAGFSFLNPKILSGEAKGNIPALAAKSTAGLYMNYQLLDALEVNAGLRYVGKRYTDSLNRFSLGAHATLDLGFSYMLTGSFADCVLRANIKNVTNEQFATAGLGGVRDNASEGRSLAASIELLL